MKKIFLFLTLILLVGLTSCVKQKNCEGGMMGTFQYFEEPMTCPMGQNYALFISTDDLEVYQTTVKNVPSKYKSGDKIKVRVILEKAEGAITYCGVVYNVKCIEKED
jgi:hypothetical protein